jgi:hypothetical protein
MSKSEVCPVVSIWAQVLGLKLPSHTLFFKCFDIFQPVQDAPPNLDVFGSFLEPSPSLQGSRAQCPSAGKLDLIQMDEPRSFRELSLDRGKTTCYCD